MRSKYGNRKTEIGGRVFDSKREANRFLQLELLEKSGLISGLTCQPRFPIVVNGMKVCTYVADFQYQEGEKTIIEDAKGMKTQVYILKKKLLKATHGIDVVEV